MQAAGGKLKDRLQGLVAIAAVPGATIGFLGDFFSPIGGSMVVGAAGIVALFIAVILLATLSAKGQRFFETRWARMTVESPESRWIWSPERPFTSHGLHVVSLFALICLFIAGKSFAAGDDGGVLAANVPGVAVAQHQLGVTQKIYDEARKTNATLGSIDTKADNFKRERSDDPRKELANIGVLWEASRLDQAIKQGDIRTVDLFLQGGMPVSARGALDAFKRENPDMAELIARNNKLFDASDCRPFLSGLDPVDVLGGERHRDGLVEALCANKAGRLVAHEHVKEMQQRYTDVEAYRKEKDTGRMTSQACIRAQENDRELGNKAAAFRMKNTLDDYDYMLASINAAIMVGRTDFSGPIKEYCDAQAVVPPRDDADLKRLNAWKKIARLVG